MTAPVWVKLIAIPLLVFGFLIGGGAAVGAALRADATGAERRTTQSMDLTGSSEVSLTIAWGGARILPGEPGRVVVEELVSVKAPTRRLAERGLDRIHTTVGHAGDSIRIETMTDPEWFLSLQTDRKLTVYVPRAANLRVEASSAAIEVAGLQGNISVTNSAGAVSVHDVDVVGQVTVHQTSGAIRFSGSVSDGQLDLRNVNGPIVATIPANTNARIEASTVNGAVSVDQRFGVSANRSPGSRQWLSADLGSGGPGSLSLSTVSGPILIQAR